MSDIQLSYVITTRNKLQFLKELLDDLLNSLEADEEVIVVDSNSNDGTAKYLGDWVASGKVAHLLSEMDYGEAHGFNKALLLAKGKFIKILSDDDVFDFAVIRSLKQMLDEQPVDLLFTPGFSNTINGEIVELDYRIQFDRWVRTGMPFPFCGLGWIINRNALPYLGLLHTGFKRVDAEYSLRITSLNKATIGYYSKPVWFRRLNSSSNSAKYANNMRFELIRLLLMHSGATGMLIWLAERFFAKKETKRTLQSDGRSLANKPLIKFINGVPSYQSCKDFLTFESCGAFVNVEQNFIVK